MILSDLKYSERIEMLHPLFKRAFDYVKTHDLLNTPCGRIELEGDDLFINNVNPECVAIDQQLLEVHREYIDIHILLEGEEIIGWKPLCDTKDERKEYSESDDCALYGDTCFTPIKLFPGQFAIVWPEDAHAPLIGEGTIRKLIVKVKI